MKILWLCVADMFRAEPPATAHHLSIRRERVVWGLFK